MTASQVATAMQVVGFVCLVLGVGLWSVPGACVTAGTILFVAGGRWAARLEDAS